MDIVRDFQRVSPAIVKKAGGYAASILADVAGRRGTLDGRITAVSPSLRMAGPAFTVEVRPGDNLMIHAAISLAKPGDILVVDGKGDRTCALMGSIMMNACKKLGLAGVILDAALRDVEEIRELGFPVYSVGTNPNGPTKFVPGRINHPISCGGITVHPGDLIVGDADGVVVVPRATAADVAKAGDQRRGKEEKTRERLAKGELGVEFYGLRAKLKELGVEYVEELPEEASANGRNVVRS